jgi:hypothetical protein
VSAKAPAGWFAVFFKGKSFYFWSNPAWFEFFFLGTPSHDRAQALCNGRIDEETAGRLVNQLNVMIRGRQAAAAAEVARLEAREQMARMLLSNIRALRASSVSRISQEFQAAPSPLDAPEDR